MRAASTLGLERLPTGPHSLLRARRAQCPRPGVAAIGQPTPPLQRERTKKPRTGAELGAGRGGRRWLGDAGIITHTCSVTAITTEGRISCNVFYGKSSPIKLGRYAMRLIQLPCALVLIGAPILAASAAGAQDIPAAAVYNSSARMPTNFSGIIEIRRSARRVQSRDRNPGAAGAVWVPARP